MKKDILIHIKSAFDAAGINATEEQLSRLAPKLNELNQKAKAAGDDIQSAFSPAKLVFAALHGNIKGVGQQLLGLVSKIKGVQLSFLAFSGIAAVISLVSVGVSKLVDHLKASEEAAKKSKDSLEKYASGCKAIIQSIEGAYSAGVSAIDKMTSQQEKQIESVKRLVLAEKELEKQRARAAGDSARVAKIEDEQKVIRAKSAKELEELRISSYNKRREEAEIAVARARRNLDKASNATGEAFTRQNNLREQVKAAANKAVDTWERSHWGQRQALLAAGPSGLAELERKRRSVYSSAYKEEWAKMRGSDEWKEATEAYKTTAAASNEATKQWEKMRKVVEEIDAAEKVRRRNNAAAKAEADAANIKNETIVIEMGKKRVQAEREERLKLEQELHAKRMENLKKLLSTRTSSADSFVSDFQAGGAGVAAERKRIEDVDKMKKIADSFKWAGTTRNLVNALNAGDTEAYQRELEWNRKYRGRSFNPNVEAAIRGVAEMRATNTTEDLLRQVANGVEGLRGDVKDLLSMK